MSFAAATTWSCSWLNMKEGWNGSRLGPVFHPRLLLNIFSFYKPLADAAYRFRLSAYSQGALDSWHQASGDYIYLLYAEVCL